MQGRWASAEYRVGGCCHSNGGGEEVGVRSGLSPNINQSSEWQAFSDGVGGC